MDSFSSDRKTTGHRMTTKLKKCTWVFILYRLQKCNEICLTIRPARSFDRPIAVASPKINRTIVLFCKITCDQPQKRWFPIGVAEENNLRHFFLSLISPSFVYYLFNLFHKSRHSAFSFIVYFIQMFCKLGSFSRVSRCK